MPILLFEIRIGRIIVAATADALYGSLQALLNRVPSSWAREFEITAWWKHEPEVKLHSILQVEECWSLYTDQLRCERIITPNTVALEIEGQLVEYVDLENCYA